MTPLTTATAYATAADVLVYCDERSIAQLLKDENQQPGREAVLASATLAQPRLAASGEVESACLPGGRYAPTDLASLTGAAQQLLVALTCGLVDWLCLRRRDREATPAEWVREKLDALRSGERIFGFTEVREAGVLGTVEWAATDAEDVDRIRNKAARFFPVR